MGFQIFYQKLLPHKSILHQFSNKRTFQITKISKLLIYIFTNPINIKFIVFSFANILLTLQSLTIPLNLSLHLTPVNFVPKSSSIFVAISFQNITFDLLNLLQ